MARRRMIIEMKHSSNLESAARGAAAMAAPEMTDAVGKSAVRSPTHGYIQGNLALAKDTPMPRRVQGVTEGDVIAFREVGGLHHRYE